MGRELKAIEGWLHSVNNTTAFGYDYWPKELKTTCKKQKSANRCKQYQKNKPAH